MTHTEPGWWLVWMLYGSLATITVEAVVDHIKFRLRLRRDVKMLRKARNATWNGSLDG